MVLSFLSISRLEVLQRLGVTDLLSLFLANLVPPTCLVVVPSRLLPSALLVNRSFLAIIGLILATKATYGGDTVHEVCKGSPQLPDYIVRDPICSI